MKTPPTDRAAESADDKRDSNKPGTFPTRKNTVTASVLASLIEGNTVTGMEAVFNQSTTRAAAVIHYLEGRYCWTIERRDIATGTNDGRVAWVTAYWLSNGAREAAFEAGARVWIDTVKQARARLRKRSAEVKARAAKLNRNFDPRQRDFFYGESA